MPSDGLILGPRGGSCAGLVGAPGVLNRSLVEIHDVFFFSALGVPKYHNFRHFCLQLGVSENLRAFFHYFTVPSEFGFFRFVLSVEGAAFFRVFSFWVFFLGRLSVRPGPSYLLFPYVVDFSHAHAYFFDVEPSPPW